MNHRVRAVLFGLALLAAAALAVLVYAGVVRFNQPSEAEYPVRGVDVSEYQGEIDWPTLAAQAAGLRAGAYHFFSFDSPGLSQAENFVATVPARDDMLPPAVDLELYGAYKADPKPADEIWPELQVVLDTLEAAYGKKPVIYVTDRAYDLYISGRDAPYDIWIRSVYFSPRVENWTFWQYADKGTLDGYAGDERHIDLNVFDGSEAAFQAY